MLLLDGILVFLLIPVIVGVAGSLCLTAPPLADQLRRPARGPALAFGRDTMAFRNDSRIHHRGLPHMYANWCFVMARAVVQFQRFARFDPAAPRLAPADYSALVRRVTRRASWRRPLPERARIVIPGFASLHELSRHDEAAVKAGLHGRFWSLVHWTNWRLVYPHPRCHQARVASQTVADIQSGRPVQLFITDFPRIKLNHCVLAYDYAATEDAVDFLVFDPNDPGKPGTLRFDRRGRRFHPAPLHGVDVPWLRAFRMHTSPIT